MYIIKPTTVDCWSVYGSICINASYLLNSQHIFRSFFHFLRSLSLYFSPLRWFEVWSIHHSIYYIHSSSCRMWTFSLPNQFRNFHSCLYIFSFGHTLVPITLHTYVYFHTNLIPHLTSSFVVIFLLNRRVPCSISNGDRK